MTTGQEKAPARPGPARAPSPILMPVILLLSCGPVGGASSETRSTGVKDDSADDYGTALGTSTTGGLPTSSVEQETATSSTPATTTSTPVDLGDSTAKCDTFAPDCPVGQKCIPWIDDGFDSYNTARCVDVAGEALPGDPCTKGLDGIDDCAAGSLCWGVDENNHGVCWVMCTGTVAEPECPPASSCGSSSQAVFGLCIPPCDPLAQDYPGDEICVPFDRQGWGCVVNASGDEGQPNDPCNFPEACDRGLMCLDAATASGACEMELAAGCCQPFCEFPEGACPNPDQACLSWYDQSEEVPSGYEDVGICAIPK